jgi:hypothetical protein
MFTYSAGRMVSLLPHCEYYLPSLLLEEVEGKDRSLYIFYLSLITNPLLNTVDGETYSKLVTEVFLDDITTSLLYKNLSPLLRK